jgi:hypothetical protein
MPRVTADAYADAVGGLTAAALATIAFVYWRAGSQHWAGTLPGHVLGVIGIALMLWAGFGYTWRKRHATPGARAMQGAMQSHIVAGLVGPYLVILHSGLAFHGLAGVLSLLMVLVVASGVVGRAIMAAIPAHIALADPVRAALLDAELARLETQQAEWARRPETDDAARDAVRREIASVRHEQELRRTEWMQVGGSAVARRAFSVWWLLHVPVSAALWVLATAHIVASLYFVTLSA